MLALPTLTMVESVILGLFVFTFVILLFVVHKLHVVLKKSKEARLEKRVKNLEQELEEYMARSGRRLDVFKRVIDGFDHIIKNVRLMIDEEREPFSSYAKNVDEVSHKSDAEAEAEVIQLDEAAKKD